MCWRFTVCRKHFRERGKADKLRYYNIAQVSLDECRYYLILIKDLEYGDVSEGTLLLVEVSKLLEAYSQNILNSDHLSSYKGSVMSIEHFGLYLVITNPATSYEACAEAAVKAGIRYIQLRMKKNTYEDVLEKARNLRSITRGSHTQFIVNDNPRIATQVEADGVHLGQDDMPLDQARKEFPELKIFGLSTHSELQAEQAVTLKPEYCGVGPVYTTPTKDIPDPDLGAELAGRIIQNAPFTTVAIGGINESNLKTVLKNGAINYSVVRYVCLAPKPYDAIMQLQEIWAKNQA